MADNRPSKSNPWSTLSTVTTFDRGNESRTTVCMDVNNETQSKGQIVGLVTPSTSLLIESLIQQLCTMFEGDPVRRNKLYFDICDRLHELKLIDSSYSMMEFETLRGQYQRALYHLVTVARASTGSDSALQAPSCLMAEWSRYRREFQEISFIAAGGFGNVYKAQHRLDGTNYAIKKIVVHSGRVESIMQHLEEVKTLAKLNHTNIVSYKGAWIEPILPSTIVPSLPSIDQSQDKPNTLDHKRMSRSHRSSISQELYSQTESDMTSGGSVRSYVGCSRQDVLLSLNKKTSCTTGYRIIGKTRSEGNVEETNSNSVSFRSDSKCSRQHNNYAENHTNNTSESDSYEESESNKRICAYIAPVSKQYATLYIQMELCENTLQQWLDERMDVTSQTIITAILTQILCGLNYIHSRGIVHHDIKPSNIFISTAGHLQIQLGDFGLACPLQRENHHSVLGTQMYAAPEQLQGKCNPKSDIYSVGIVLLELLVHTKTHMERHGIISGVKRGKIPTTLAATYPKWAYIVSQLVRKDPNDRPSTSQLLQDLNEDKDVTIAQLRSDLAQKDHIIQELQGKISMLEQQIVKFTIPLPEI